MSIIRKVPNLTTKNVLHNCYWGMLSHEVDPNSFFYDANEHFCSQCFNNGTACKGWKWIQTDRTFSSFAVNVFLPSLSPAHKSRHTSLIFWRPFILQWFLEAVWRNFHPERETDREREREREIHLLMLNFGGSARSMVSRGNEQTPRERSVRCSRAL